MDEEISALAAANVHLFFLPSYSPELSEIEPVWQAVKHHEMQRRSFSMIRDLKDGVEAALSNKAQALLQAQQGQDKAQQGQDKRQNAMQETEMQETDKLLCGDT